MNQLLLIVRIGGERVAVPAHEVEAVVEIGNITPAPRSAAHVAGLAALRSRVLTVIDCMSSLGTARPAQSGVLEAMIVVADGHPYALLVDGVEDVIEADDGPVALSASLDPAWRRVALGMVEAEKDMLLLVDVKALITGPVAEAA